MPDQPEERDIPREKLKVQPVKRAYQQVADQLRQLIVGGDLRPGTRLPSESQLSRRFEVSRGTIREALRSLTSERLIFTAQGTNGGSFVAQPQPGNVSDLLVANIGLLTGSDAISISELIEARELLEIPATRLAAVRRTDEHLAALEKTLPGSPDSLSEETLFRLNRAFHEIILEAAGNRLLRVIADPIFSVLRTRFSQSSYLSFRSQHVREHVEIAQAIRSGDADAASVAMLEHLEHLRPAYAQVEEAVRSHDNEASAGQIEERLKSR